MNKNDILLMEGAYNSILLRSQLANLTVRQLEVVIENASNYELDVLEELFGGVKNLLASAGKGIERGASAAKDKALGAKRAVTAGAKQVGSNIKNIYQTGEQEAAANKRKQDVANSVSMLIQQLKDLKSSSEEAGQEIGNIEDMTVGEIQTIVTRGARAAHSTARRDSRAATNNGIFGGAGTAAADAYSNPQA